MLTHNTLLPAKATRVSHLSKVPKLRHGGDEERAAQLDTYISRAESGLVSIIQAGFFIECITADLPHGQIGSWVETWCKHRTWRTVQRWQQIAGKVGEEVLGLKYEQRIRLPIKLYELLDLPIEQVPDKVKPLREKLDAEISGKSYRQLFLRFSQSDDGESPKVGRRKGSDGNPKHKRDAFEARTAEEQREVDEQLCHKMGAWLKAVANDARAGHPDFCQQALAALHGGVESFSSYLRSKKHTR